MTIRVFIVDDHAIVRTGLRMILSAQVDIDVVGEADSGEAAGQQHDDRDHRRRRPTHACIA